MNAPTHELTGPTLRELERQMLLHVCACGHMRADHPTPFLCGVEGCDCGEYEEQGR